MEDIRANLKEAIARGRDPYLNAQQCDELVRLIDLTIVDACYWQLIAPSGEVRATERSCVLALARIDGYKPTVENLLAYEMNGWQVRPVPRTPGVPVTQDQPSPHQSPIPSLKEEKHG